MVYFYCNIYTEESIQTRSKNSNFSRPLNINPLITKAATNIDIGAMGSKGIF